MEDKKLLNLEDTVGYLVDRANLASIGATLKGQVDTYDALPAEVTVGDVYAVGTTKPYTYYAFTDNGWLDIGTWPLAGPKGVPGDRGPQGPAGPVGPKGDKGNQGIAGPAGGGVGVDRITELDLAVGNASLAYSNTTGAALVKQGTITAAGQDYSISVNDRLPITPGKNVSIKPNTANTALVIGADMAVTSVNGKTGDVSLTIPTSTSQLVNDAEFVPATNLKTINNESLIGTGNIEIGGGGTAGVTSLNSKTGAITLAAGNNVTINESGNTLTINATGGGGGGTDTGFGNVSRIEAADNQTTYNPDTKEYIISSGNADIFYKDGTKTTIPYVQEIGLMAGNNITFTEEFVDNANYRVKINATGGGSSTDGFSNLKGLTLTPTTYQGAESPSGKFAFTGSGTYTLKDNSSGGIQELSFQLPVIPGDGIIFDKTTDGNCAIKAADYKPTITLETYTASQNTSHYGRIYYTFDVGNSTVATDIANNKYNVTIYDQTSGGGYYYCPLQGENMTFLGEETPNADGTPSSIVGWSFKAKESEAVVSFWRDSLSLGGGGGGGSSLYQHTIKIQGSQYKYTITVVNSYQGSITGANIWKEIYGNNRFTVPAIVADSMDKTAAISSVYVYITPTNSLQVLFFPANQSSQNSETISSSASWEDNIISL